LTQADDLRIITSAQLVLDPEDPARPNRPWRNLDLDEKEYDGEGSSDLSWNPRPDCSLVGRRGPEGFMTQPQIFRRQTTPTGSGATAGPRPSALRSTSIQQALLTTGSTSGRVPSSLVPLPVPFPWSGTMGRPVRSPILGRLRRSPGNCGCTQVRRISIA
jgi:hypothetical protein